MHEPLGQQGVSVVIPFFNEALSIENAITKVARVLDRLTTKWEIVAVDDGSTDTSAIIVANLAHEYSGKLVIRKHHKNFGPGKAFATGFRSASFDKIVTIDSDLSYSPDDIPSLLAALRECDIAIGSPFMRNGDFQNVKFLRRLISKLGNSLYGVAVGTRLTCYTGFFRAYKRFVIEHINIESFGFESQAEILAKAVSAGYRAVEVPVNFRGRVEGKSKFKTKREITRHIKLLFWILKKRFGKSLQGSS